MRANPHTRRPTVRLLQALGGALVALCLMAPVAVAAPLDLDEAEQERRQAATRGEQRQAELDDLLSRIEALRVAREQQAEQIERLEAEVAEQEDRAAAARARVSAQYNQAYRTGTAGDPLIDIFGGAEVDEVAERARVLGLLASRDAEQREEAEGASARTAALAEQLDAATGVLAERTDELAARQGEAEEKVAAAQAEVEQLDEDIAAERERRAEAERRRRARERAQREAEASERAAQEAEEEAAGSGDAGSGSGSGGAEVSGGVACPVGDPVSFSDTWGAARSGGRSHEGVDMLAPMGTPIYAYEDGVVTSTDPSSLGGISLYLTGDSGNRYFYTHLSGFVSGISGGTRVTAGQHIAHNGDSGNAAGIPHLHFEVRPGGGAKVNPYPYAARACD